MKIYSIPNSKVKEKLQAFIELFEKQPLITVHGVLTTYRGDLLFATYGVDVVSIGSKYVLVKADGEEVKVVRGDEMLFQFEDKSH